MDPMSAQGVLAREKQEVSGLRAKLEDTIDQRGRCYDGVLCFSVIFEADDTSACRDMNIFNNF